jgi:hypothetical protein
MKYSQVSDGDWVRPVMKKYRLACCDCGLVHRIDFKVQRGHVLFRPTRDARATAAIRRKK